MRTITKTTSSNVAFDTIEQIMEIMETMETRPQKPMPRKASLFKRLFYTPCIIPKRYRGAWGKWKSNRMWAKNDKKMSS